MFLRSEFYAPNVKQGLVRSPFEWMVNVGRQTGWRSDTLKPMWILGPLGQQPFDPPNVSGWRQNRYWLSSAATSQRGSWAGDIGYRVGQAGSGPLNDLVSVPVPQAVQAVFDRLGIDAPSALSRSALTNWWNGQRASVDSWYELIGLHQVALLLPELQVA
jgi:hypothetical protein